MKHLKKIYKKKKKYKKSIFMTGGNRGIGKKILMNVSKEIYITITTTSKNKNTKKLNHYLKNIKKKNIITLTIDLGNNKKLKKILSFIKKKIDTPIIIINNAAATEDSSLVTMREEQWSKIININLNSIYIITKHHLKKMITVKWGRIINIGSIIASTGNIGQTNYSTSKSGMIGFAKSLAKEVARKNITINTISPGFILTKMTKKIKNIISIKKSIPMGKLGKTKDIAYIVQFIISNKSAYITGETLNANGGLFMK